MFLIVVAITPLAYYGLLILSAILCLAGYAFGSTVLCVPASIGSNASENIRDSILFYQTQRKIKNQTADGVDNFLYAKMIWKDDSWKQSAHKVNPNIPKDELGSFYLKKSADMDYREAIVSQAMGLASDGTQEFIHGSHDKANQRYKCSGIINLDS